MSTENEFRYSLKILITNLNEQPDNDISNYLEELSIHKDYSLNKPIYIFKFSLPIKFAHEISNSPNFKIFYSSILNKTDLNSSFNFTEGNDLEEQNSIFLKPFSFTQFQLTRKELDKIQESNFKVVDSNNETVEFIIEAFDFNHLQLNESFGNFTLKNTTVEKVINVLYEQTKLTFNEFNFKKPDNLFKYPEIFIPPMRFLNAIDYLNSTFGIYKTKAILFANNNTLTLRASDEPLNLINNIGKYNPINLYVRSDASDGLDSLVIENILPYDISYTKRINIQNRVSEILRNRGSKIILMDESNTFAWSKDLTVDLKKGLEDYLTNKITDKTSLIVNDKRNRKFFLEQYISDIKKDMITTQITINNTRELLFNTETMFNIVLENETNFTYSGLWETHKQEIKYVRNNADFSCDVSVSLYKVLKG